MNGFWPFVVGLKVRVYTEVGKTYQGKFALDVALQTLPFYAKYVINHPSTEMLLSYVANTLPSICPE
jgi:hypothetical protein